MNAKEIKIAQFDPNGAGLKESNVYGLPFTAEESDIVLIPVPWEVTVSYGSGAALGPAHIFDASFQVDLHHEDFPELWKRGIAMIDIPTDLGEKSEMLRQKAEVIIAMFEEGIDVNNDPKAKMLHAEINAACEEMNQWVEDTCTYWLNQGKQVGLVGGDHSTPLGYLRAQGKRHDEYGILHIDAHMDLRIAYEGFTYSHASIMYNALSIPQLKSLVSVGIRDFCEQEANVVKESDDRIAIYSSNQLRRRLFEGENWKQICNEIVSRLPQKVHISFDIDGLDPTLCPNTGTPVPGGLWFEEATYLISQIRKSGRELIGFDLVEVAPGDDDWNGNVGARMLFYLCGSLSMKS
ncbi:MAG: agmatinase [Cryomorphaceae bacterium]|nr:agmatinase [Cryomorphaceae bacterium]